MHVLEKVIESQKKEIENILDRKYEELYEMEVRQIGYCLGNIKTVLR